MNLCQHFICASYKNVLTTRLTNTFALQHRNGNSFVNSSTFHAPVDSSPWRLGLGDENMNKNIISMLD